MRTYRSGWLCAAALVALMLPPHAGADDWNEGRKYFEIALRWSNYATYGQQYAADVVVDSLIEARQQRIFITAIENRIDTARAATEARLAKERQREFAGSPDAATSPSREELRRQQRRIIRDLERTLAAYDAVEACLDPENDLCTEVRDIDRQRAEWRDSGDPLPPDPDIPGDNDLREMLEAALARHRLTLDRHRRDLERLQRLTNRLAGAHLIFEERLDELGEMRRSVQQATTELQRRRASCSELCSGARSSAEAARQLAAGADPVLRSVEGQLADARALAASCGSIADADRLLDLVGTAERARDAVATDLDRARAANNSVRSALSTLQSSRDVSDLRTTLREIHTASGATGGVLIDQQVEITSAFEGLKGPRDRIASVADELTDLSALDDEVRSWERALSADPATQTMMRRRFDELRREYELLGSEAKRAVSWADELTDRVGRPDLLQTDFERAGVELREAEEAAAAVDMPDCDVVEVDLGAFTLDHTRIQELLRAAPDLRRAADDCRARAASGPGTAPPVQPPSASGAAPGSGTGATPPTVAAAAPSPSGDVFGGLVIAGLPPPARITVGQAVQLEGRDHGGRPYSGVEWVTSNEQVLPVDGAGRIVGRQKGEAMVLAKLDGMRAWLDVEVVDPGSSPATPPAVTGAGTPGGGPSGGTSPGVPNSAAAGVSPAASSTPRETGATDGFDFGDGGSGTVEIEPSEDGLLGVSPTIDPGPPSAPPPSDPPSMDLLGVDSAADGSAGAPPDSLETFDGGSLPTADGTLFELSEGFGDVAQAPAPPAPSGPSQAEILAMLQQVDCSWLSGGVPAYDQGSGRIGCTCPPGTQPATDRPACLDCAGPQQAFMGAVQARDFQQAQQAILAAQGCDWAPSAQAQLRDFVCTQAEIAVLEALNTGGPGAAQQAMMNANAQGCGISPQTAGLVASAAQPPPSYGAAPPPRSGPDAAEMMQLLSTVTQSLIAMQGGDPAPLPSVGQPAAPSAAAPPAGAPSPGGQAHPGEAPEQCARRLCERECADAIGLLTAGTTPACDQCLKRQRPGCSASGAPGPAVRPSGGSDSIFGPDSAFSSGSGAWADPHWTEPTGEGGGRCYAGQSWTRPVRYAIACDGNDGTAIFKLATGGYPSLVYGPASFTDCQRVLARLTGGQ